VAEDLVSEPTAPIGLLEDASPHAVVPPAPDLTGRDRMAWNVFAGWAGYFVMAVAGLLAPRVMDRSLGQESLGVWDFGWSLVTYFTLTQLGVGSAVNRYVARHRASNDVAGLRRVTASVAAINAVAAAVTLLLTAVAVWLVPRLMSADLARVVGQARILVGLLGATVASQVGLQLYQGVIAGCHRFDLHHAITTTFEVATSLAIVAALLAGGGLISLGVICLSLEIASQLTRMFWAYRICPEMRVSPAYVDRKEMVRVLRFGLKTLLDLVAALLLVQASKLIVGTYFGLATLAVFSRPLALIRMIDSFSNKLANVFSPTASALEGGGRHDELATLTLEGTRLGVALVLPMTLVLVVLGDPIMTLWMGPRYAPGPWMALLALGFLAQLAVHPMAMILIGLNRHGRVALASLCAAGAGVVLGLLNAVSFGWGLTGAAAAIAIPLLGEGTYVLWYSLRTFRISLRQFLTESLLAPVACAVPFVIVLVCWRVLVAERQALMVSSAVITGGLLLLPLYWNYVLPPGLRDQILQIPQQVRRLARP
jgi:O-antigen/teichoic acid export membrane protein